MKTKRMNKKVKQLWVKALRGGKYKKGTRRLKDENRFCCLGVLTDLWRHEVKPDWDSDQEIPEICSDLATLPNHISKWAGLESDDPEVKVKGGTSCLSGLNDDGYGSEGPFSFKKIADLIEKQL